ncbi:MAG: antibiotic biosynthesis monooxygenase [Clostridia bacterium]|nr:antibiotic biosynthesis monooxygenase [Clostridia bacterium]
MSLTVNIYYTGQNGNAVKFAEEMVSSGVVNAVRNEKGNLKYEYYFPMDDKETVLLIDCWENQEALDIHHKSPMMEQIAYLRKKYKLKMKVERFNSN